MPATHEALHLRDCPGRVEGNDPRDVLRSSERIEPDRDATARAKALAARARA